MLYGRDLAASLVTCVEHHLVGFARHSFALLLCLWVYAGGPMKYGCTLRQGGGGGGVIGLWSGQPFGHPEAPKECCMRLLGSAGKSACHFEKLRLVMYLRHTSL